MERAGHVYSRISNPTVAVLEERIAALERGVGAIATASGQAALHLAIATLVGAGSHIVASRALYGGSHNLLAYTLARFGIETTFVDPRDLGAWRAALRPNTRLLFGETLGNPGLDVLDIPAVADRPRARRAAAGRLHLHHAVADDPLRSRRRPGLSLGDQVPLRPWHGDRRRAGRRRQLRLARLRQVSAITEPYEGFHGMVFAEESTVAPFLLRARREGLRDFGACMSPIRLSRSCRASRRCRCAWRAMSRTRARWRSSWRRTRPSTVAYPELESHPDHALAKRLLPRGGGAVFSFDLKGARAAGRAFVEALQVFSHLANVGDAKSLVIHPASTTHFRMQDAGSPPPASARARCAFRWDWRTRTI